MNSPSTASVPVSAGVVRECPRCQSGMTTGHLGPVELSACARCRGVWFPAGQLAVLAQGGAAAFERLLTAVRQRAPLVTRSLGTPRCPACRIPLESIEYASLPGVSLDACQV